MSGNDDSPKQGDIVWIDAEPHAGHEYGGHDSKDNIRRPMLVISSDTYNRRTGMITGFPITFKIPTDFYASLKLKNDKIHGYIILSNLLGYDFSARRGKVVSHVNKQLKEQALSAIRDIFSVY
ncbi:type II toxin-antitoxin system PemK/MazF family toxin [Companilactobacillus heilongjiangensis]|uniref:Cell division protein FtsW n=1 Tax=Companilactobacillus heilongjiangensis TaxID=1074467 RepID=A0A0K2LBP2_9LACO|nr:type II toxin-antitoxin system PemK/MazF family toxin [Companilactobacillus heilongjiangensis]ALB28727.1 cell division protein FtsW [Companilactobacillus heilongjiangensis]